MTKTRGRSWLMLVVSCFEDILQNFLDPLPNRPIKKYTSGNLQVKGTLQLPALKVKQGCIYTI